MEHKQFLVANLDETKSYDESRVVVQLAEYEHTSSYGQGSKNGPQAIIDSSHFVEYFDEETGVEVFNEVGIHTAEPILFGDSKNQKALELILKRIQYHVNDGKFPVMLAGEHTCTLPAFQACLTKYPNLSVLQLDAHADLRDAYEGNRYSHASVMARINEMKPAIAQVGLRAICKEEFETIQTSDNILSVFGEKAVMNDSWHDEVLNHLGKDVYVTIDADAFDPSVIPGTGTPEPGGLEWYPTLSFLKKVFTQKNVVAFDIVECSPRSGEIISEFTLAKLMYKLLGYRYLNKIHAL